MRVGVPKEIKVHEYRVGLTPASVAELVAAGHEVVVETKAGDGIDSSDQDYVEVGARIAGTAAEVFAQADMIVKVKEPQAQEIALLEPRHLLFTYLHLAPDPDQAEGLMKSGATCIAYETVTAQRRLAAAAEADERSRGPDVGPGRRALSGEGAGRPRRAARRRAGRRAGAGRDPRRRRLGRQRGADGGRHARRRHHLRHLERPAGRTRHVLRQPDQDRLRLPGGDRPCGQEGEAGDRRGAGARRRGAQARHPRDAEDDEARLGAGRHRDRPGRLLRNLAADDARAIRSTRSTASSIIASPTCPARWPAPPPSRSTTRRCRSR